MTVHLVVSLSSVLGTSYQLAPVKAKYVFQGRQLMHLWRNLFECMPSSPPLLLALTSQEYLCCTTSVMPWCLAWLITLTTLPFPAYNIMQFVGPDNAGCHALM